MIAQQKRPVSALPAFLCLVAALAPAPFVSFEWWPVGATLLFAAFVLAVSVAVQGRALTGMFLILCAAIIGPATLFFTFHH